MAKASRRLRPKPLDGKGKGTLKAKAPRWKRPFDGKGTSMAMALGTLKAQAPRLRRPFYDPGKGTLNAKTL